jgi:putative mRNA 3-end processing factor
VSLHPAGHILGSAQVRLESRGEIWVVSGDFKIEPDPTCAPFEPLPCHVFITESTFGLPIYRWPTPATVFADINAWWRANREAGKASLLYGYALGKAQRLLAGLDASIGPIYLHGAVDKMTAAYREAGVSLPPTQYAAAERGFDWSGSLILAPPSAHQTPWMRKFGTVSTGFASGWMTIRGTRRRKAVDRGFVLSDHADWPGLLTAIEAAGAERIGVTHGYSNVLVRWLQERGKDAWALPTRYEGEGAEGAVTGEPAGPSEPEA